MSEPKTELQRNAIAEATKKELETYQRALDVQWLNSRMDDGRMGRLLALMRREEQMEKEYHERTDHAAIVNSIAAKETALGFEISKVRQAEVCEQQRRHFLREQDPELRGLIRKLEAGYNCRDLKQQILHNELRRMQEKADDRASNELLLKALDDGGEEQREMRDKMERGAKYRHELQQQLVNRQRQKQCQYEDTLIEKKMLDEVIRAISDEDKKELEQKRMLSEKMRYEMKTFQQARLAWRDKQKQMVINEEHEIEKQQLEQSMRKAAGKAEQERILKAREDSNLLIATKIRAAEEEREKRADIVRTLQELEYAEKSVQDEIAEKEKLMRTKNVTMAALRDQMATKQRLIEEQKVRDLEIRKMTEAKAVEEKLKEQEKQRLIREKNRAYAAELLKQAESRRAERKAGRAEEEQQAKVVWDYYKARDKETSEERKKIIEEHAPPLLGFLQCGVLREEDLPVVRAGANKHADLAKLDIEGMGNTKRHKIFSKCNPQCLVIREY